jgi:hypothetical protein
LILANVGWMSAGQTAHATHWFARQSPVDPQSASIVHGFPPPDPGADCFVPQPANAVTATNAAATTLSLLDFKSRPQ